MRGSRIIFIPISITFIVSERHFYRQHLTHQAEPNPVKSFTQEPQIANERWPSASPHPHREHCCNDELIRKRLPEQRHHDNVSRASGWKDKVKVAFHFPLPLGARP
ncbi:uncharacterized [Tachysurus ichikawai]